LAGAVRPGAAVGCWVRGRAIMPELSNAGLVWLKLVRLVRRLYYMGHLIPVLLLAALQGQVDGLILRALIMQATASAVCVL